MKTVTKVKNKVGLIIKKTFNLINFNLNDFFKIFLLYKWFKLKRFSPPSPPFVKRDVLYRHGIKDSTWVETGTFKGDTTKMLAKFFRTVHTIEPSTHLIKRAKKVLLNYKNIYFHNGTSESCFEDVCQSIDGDISFWLDGHYSSGETFQASLSTPIKHELDVIKRNKSRFSNMVILIDDLRCSFREKSDYPPLDYYVSWAKSMNYIWYIEHDIFIIKSKENDFFKK